MNLYHSMAPFITCVTKSPERDISRAQGQLEQGPKRLLFDLLQKLARTYAATWTL